MTDLADETVQLVDAAWRQGLRPELQMTVTEWADTNRVLPNATAEPGPWRTSRVPYLKDIMDCLSTSSAIERVVLMKGAQTGGTEAGLNAIGYWIAHAPGMILAVWPSIDMVRRNSRSRIEPLIEDTPALRARIAPARAKDPGNTVGMKEFPGGALIMTGANSATGLRSTAARYLVLDEVDAFPADAGGEGDPVALAEQRTVSFRGRRKIFLISTPTEAGVSRIEKAYAESDQRRYFVPCPHCGSYQPLAWRGITWPEGEPAKAFYVCQADDCGGVMEEADKTALLAKGEWRATATGNGRTAGFHLSGLYSPFESWGEIARAFLTAKRDPAQLKAWTNLKLGEPYEDRDLAPLAPDTLAARGLPCDPPWTQLLPEGVAVITAGVDTQDDRIEVEFVGWGRGEASWSLDYEIVHGDTSRPEVWAVLDRLLARRFAHPKAIADLPVLAVAVDSGGHRTDQVMRFSAERLNRRVWAIKGRGGPGVPPWPKRPPKARIASLAPVHIVGVDTLKHGLLSRLRIDDGGPGACHWPADRDYLWFTGLVAERPVRRYTRGVARIEWVPDPGVRNEPLDCRVYATAALHGLYAAGLSLSDLADKCEAALPANTSAPQPSSSPKPAGVLRSQWMSR
ncbi:phage terminase large subunit family protein [Ancylobacter amanitiformis]|uniref:Phage terminase large subunit GpA-like protein n=1 Tax=Ancylobacter amanitiformis TaxID=217069 RepID=A0ABU0LVK6_9HYPH|nr:phage terminase large subunit family protein [Ancylobacter amanitiformis]MDQ0512714.1 phage terminase large subunit GpA-like protein [Ancylobacter amanitiformis]